LVLTPLYPPRRFGGIEKIVMCLVDGLALGGDEVAVVTLDPNEDSKRTKDGSVSIARICCDMRPGSIDTIIEKQEIVINTALDLLEKCCRPVIIHAHDWFVAKAATKLSYEINAPLLSVFHSDKYAEYGGRLKGDHHHVHALQKMLAHQSDAVFCYSDFMCHTIARSTGVPYSHIIKFHCGIEDHASPGSLPPRAYPPRILYLGRLAPEKDVPTLVRAFSIVAKEQPICQLKVVGSGSQLEVLKQLVADLDLQPRVTFTPFTESQDLVDEELRAATVLVLPSKFEPFGLVVLEAIARYLPVIVPDVGGPAEIIKDRVTGYRFCPGDEADLSDKILNVLRDYRYAQQMAVAALRDASYRYCWNSAVSTIRRVCEKLVTKKSVVKVDKEWKCV